MNCPDEDLRTLIEAMNEGAEAPLAIADALLVRYPDDARLHFLRGSMLAGSGRLIEAHDSLARAVALAPDYAIARFQLGFFQLTSGEADAALETWGRLDRLPHDNYLRIFADGLRALIRDEFSAAIQKLQSGLARNTENPPLNRDMQLIVDKISALQQGDDAPISETSLILGQFSRRDRT